MKEIWIDLNNNRGFTLIELAMVVAILSVLATGAIENARLLLASNKRRKAGLGNQNGLVGRYFLEHAREAPLPTPT